MDPEVFRIYQKEPLGCLGCTVILFAIALTLLMAGYLDQSTIQIILAGCWLIFITRSMFSHIRYQSREKKSQSRVEYTDIEMRVYSEFGIMERSVLFDQVVGIAKYQGTDTSKQPFNVSVLKIQDGSEFIMPDRIKNSNRLFDRIEHRTGHRFQYRKNATRYQ